MLGLLYGHDRTVATWVAERIPHMRVPPAPCVAIGVVHDGRLIAGVIYHGWLPDQRGIEISMAAQSPRWATRATVRGLLAYPFEQLGCRWVLACVPRDNERALRLATGVGFVQRGVLPDFYAEKRHAVVLTMPAKAWGRLFSRSSRKETR